MRTLPAVAAGLALAAALTLPAAAEAAFTVSYSASSGLLVQGDAESDGASLKLENGRYEVFVGTEQIAPIRVQRATLVAGDGCFRQTVPNVRVICHATGNLVITGSFGAASDWLGPSGTVGDMFVDGGLGDDIVEGGTGFDAVDGGPGNDLVRGGPGNDVVEGGDGKDTVFLDGTSGTDILRGEAGDDTFRASGFAASPDRIDGGSGVDTADYSNRDAAVALRVVYGGARVADDGQAGEGDDIGEDVEALIGGDGSDVIAMRHLEGTPAPSRVQQAGRGGSDRLTAAVDVATDFDPGIGVDLVEGSSASDRVLGRDGENDRVDCNGGIDAFVADLRDSPISPECEQVDQGAVDEGPNVVVRSKALRVGRDGAVAVRLRCPRRLRISCAGRLAVRLDRSGARFGGATRYRIRRGRSATVTVRLAASQRTRARRRGARLRLRSVERGSHGPKTTLRSVRARR